MLVKIEARILIFPGTDFHFPGTSVPPGTFLGSAISSSLPLPEPAPQIPTRDFWRHINLYVYVCIICICKFQLRAVARSRRR